MYWKVIFIWQIMSQVGHKIALKLIRHVIASMTLFTQYLDGVCESIMPLLLYMESFNVVCRGLTYLSVRCFFSLAPPSTICPQYEPALMASWWWTEDESHGWWGISALGGPSPMKRENQTGICYECNLATSWKMALFICICLLPWCTCTCKYWTPLIMHN